MDPYTTLEVSHDASLDQIKKAYRKMALKWHPDKNGGSLDAGEMFRKVKAAYDCLVDPIKRAAEDLKRKQAEAAEKTHSQSREKTSRPPPTWRWTMSPGAVVFVLLAVIVMIAALLRTNTRGTASASA